MGSGVLKKAPFFLLWLLFSISFLFGTDNVGSGVPRKGQGKAKIVFNSTSTSKPYKMKAIHRGGGVDYCGCSVA